MILRVCIQHAVMDGIDFGRFIDVLAENCRHERAGQPTLERTKDRSSLLTGLAADTASKDHPEYKIIQMTSSVAAPTPPALPPMTTRIFTLTPNNLAALEAAASTHLTPSG